jgi:hypothetical protein
VCLVVVSARWVCCRMLRDRWSCFTCRSDNRDRVCGGPS